MKLRNKKTGEIGFLTAGSGIDHYVVANNEWKTRGKYNSLVELNEEWEDYEESEGYFEPALIDNNVVALIVDKKTSREEAEKAVEKLKAYKRLKDKGIRIVGWDYSVNVDLNGCKFNGDDFIVGLSAGDIDEDDLDLLFGGK